MKVFYLVLSLHLITSKPWAVAGDEYGTLRATKAKASKPNKALPVADLSMLFEQSEEQASPKQHRDLKGEKGKGKDQEKKEKGKGKGEKGPPEPSDNRCNPRDSFVLFPGHNQACSWKEGWVNITWSPAFVYHVSSDELIWCGDYVYDVFIGRGIEGTDNIYEGLDIDELINGRNWDHFPTTETSIQLENYEAGADYQILVTAKTASGHVSFNRRPANIEMARADPLWQDDYEGWINLPYTNDQFQVETRQGTDGRHVVKFSGTNIPQKVREIVVNYHVYFFTSDGGADFGRATEIIMDTEEVVEWVYTPADLSDVFKELDVSADVHDTAHGKGLDDIDEVLDLGPEEEEDLDALLENMSINVRLHLCKHAYPDRPLFDCYLNDPGEEETSRMLVRYGQDDRMLLRCCKRLQRAVRTVKKAAAKVAKVVVDTAKKVAETVKDVVDAVLDAEITIDRTQTFLEIDKGGKMSCFDEALQVGINFDASARANLKITVGIFKAVVDAKVVFFGGIGAQAYVFLQASGEKTFKPDPITLFQVERDVLIFVGPVPVLITHRPTVSAFIEITLNAEAEALLPVSGGWDYQLGFEIKGGKADTIQKFERRPPPEQDPVFELRLALEADVGIALEWQILFFKLIQASVSFDLGLNLETGVGTNLDAIALTPPFFYILDHFNIDFFIRLRAAIGLNEDIGDAIEDIKGDDSEDTKRCEFLAVPYEIPSFDAEEPSLPDIFVDTVSKAQAEEKFDDEVTLEDFLAEAGVEDTFTGSKGTLSGPVDDFSLSFVIFREDFTLLSVPEISVHPAGEASFCTEDGQSAIVLPLTSALETSGLALKGIINAEWFVNLDGELFDEDSPWVVSGGDLNNPDSLVLELPRSALKDTPTYAIEDGASVFIRATPQLLPFPPNSLFAKGTLQDLFPEVSSFECCDDKDCKEHHKPGKGFEMICDSNRLCVEREK